MSLDPAQLSTLAAVVRAGSFEAAARALHITASAVSQRVKALEETVGQVLVRRAKPCRVTEAGRPLLRLAGQVAVLEREALAAARGDLAIGGPARTRMAIAANADSLATWFPAALAALPEQLRPCFDLYQDDQDHTAELLRDGSVMAGVTAQNAPVQGCRVRRLGAMRYVAMASAGFRDRYFADTMSADALANAPMLVFNRKDQLQHRFVRTLTRRRLDPPVHFVPSVPAFTEAIRLGLGWGMVPQQIASDEVAAGRAVVIADGRHFDVPLFWQHWRLDSTLLGALTAAVSEVAATSLRR